MKFKSSTEQIIAAVGVCLILALAGDLTLYVVLPVVAVNSGIQLAQIGFLLSANRFIRFISNPIVGYLLRSHKRKGFLVGGLILGGLSTLMYQFYDIFWLFLAGRILWGVAFSLSYITAYAIVMDVTTDERRGRDSGLLQSFYLIGFAVTPFIGAILNNVAGFQITMLICSLAGLLGAVVALIFVPETNQPWYAELTVNELPHDSDVSRMKSLASTLREFFQYKIIAANLVYTLTFFVGEGILLSTISYYFLKNFGNQINLGLILIPAATAGGFVLALRASSSALLAPLAGRLSDRSKNRWQIIVVGALLGVIGLTVITMTKAPSVFILGIILFAVNGAIIPSVIPAILSDQLTTGQVTLKIGVLATAADIGLALAPLASYAFLVDHSISELYYGGAGILMVSMLVALIATRVDVPQRK